MATKKIDKRIKAAYYKKCRGIAIPIMKITDVFRVGRDLIAAGADDATLEAGIFAFVQTIAPGGLNDN